MKTIFKIIFLLLTLLLVSCKEQAPKKEFQTIDNVNYQTVTIENDTAKVQKMVTYFKPVLDNPTTPKLAKLLLTDYASNSDEPLAYFDQLKSKEKKTKEFYFKVIGNTCKYADGSYAEGLGTMGKEYVEENTKDFVAFFDTTICFSDKDLEAWADIVMLEFSILLDEDMKAELINPYIAKLEKNCSGCSKAQQRTLTKFETLLRAKVKEYKDNFSN